MEYKRAQFSEEQLLHFYKALLKPRLVEEKMLLLLRKGSVSKWFSGIGQEAVSVGAALALQSNEYILPLHRNLGVFTSRQVPLNRLFSQFQGKMGGFTQGRDRSFHFGAKEYHIVGMISHLGPQLAVADGIALAQKLSGNQRATLVFTGDGGTSEGDFHEALNLAAVWQLPVVFLVENNGYSLSTPTEEQFRISNFSEKGRAYAIPSQVIDGNNILEVYETVEKATESARKGGGPQLIEAVTFRMRGHEEASGTKYVPETLFQEWAEKDPVDSFEQFLTDQGILNYKSINAFRNEIREEIDQAWAWSEQDEFPKPSPEHELNDVYAPALLRSKASPAEGNRSLRFVDAIREAQEQSLERFPNLVLMGQDIAEYGGVFKATENLVQRFGKERVRNTPLCESAIVGCGLGLSILNHKSVMEMQFSDFVSCGFNQIVNNLAKTHYRWNQAADMVIRMPAGAGTAAGPFHSQSNEAWFFHTPGLKIVYPSTPYEAKGLLCAAIEDPNPVLFFESKALYRSMSGMVPQEYYTLSIGPADLKRRGESLSIVTYGQAVHWAIEALEQTGIEADLIDLRCLLPWDKEMVLDSVKKTGKVLVVHEANLTGGVGAEIAATIAEEAFSFLDAPIMRIGGLDTPIPFQEKLEAQYLPQNRLKEALEKLSRW